MNPNTTTEYRDLPLAVLTESTTNPRRILRIPRLKSLPRASAFKECFRPCLCGL
jgi:hypothetical protein